MHAYIRIHAGIAGSTGAYHVDPPLLHCLRDQHGRWALAGGALGALGEWFHREAP